MDILERENDMMRLSVPKNWNVYMKGNAVLQMTNQFEKLMLQVGEHTNQDLETISTFRFYNLLDYIKSKNSNG